MGLRDQLLKAGLVSKKQAQKAEANKRKQEHEAHKNQDLAKELAEEKAREQERLEAEAARKREEDRQRNLEIEAVRLEKQKLYRVRQLLKSNDLYDDNAERPYYFSEESRFVRSIPVTQFQREMLARGKIGIVRTDEASDDGREFVLVPAHTVRTVRSLVPDRFTLLHTPLEDWQDVAEVVEKEFVAQGNDAN